MTEQNIVPKEGSKLLRTILRADVYDRLENYAKSLGTGRGHWDFGVAIERLLDWATLDEKFMLINERLIQLETKILGEDMPQNKTDKTYLVGGYDIGENNEN